MAISKVNGKAKVTVNKGNGKEKTMSVSKVSKADLNKYEAIREIVRETGSILTRDIMTADFFSEDGEFEVWDIAVDAKGNPTGFKICVRANRKQKSKEVKESITGFYIVKTSKGFLTADGKYAKDKKEAGKIDAPVKAINIAMRKRNELVEKGKKLPVVKIMGYHLIEGQWCEEEIEIPSVKETAEKFEPCKDAEGKYVWCSFKAKRRDFCYAMLGSKDWKNFTREQYEYYKELYPFNYEKKVRN